MEGATRRTLLWLAVVGLPTVIVTIAVFTVLYYIIHNSTLANYLSIATPPILVGGATETMYRRRVRTYGRRVASIRTLSLNMDNPEPISDEDIETFESALSTVRKDSEDYVRLHAMLGHMHLHNAVTKGDRRYYLKAVDHLNKAEETINRVNVGDDTRLMVNRLRSRIEGGSRYRFES
ncbi:hypothetical protein [Vulcanisaeta distributa]|uniref:hypothetical protein n=1 Tax=Vulcanisaeta distributa TaxID=164451 RepID=UPI0006D2B425|nr:hypothetical protein [Vulcanisaeta distributa]